MSNILNGIQKGSIKEPKKNTEPIVTESVKPIVELNSIEKFNKLLEGISQEELAGVLNYRLQTRYPDIYNQYDPQTIENAVNDVASFYEGADELGSSDISIMLRHLIKTLEEKQGVAEGSESEQEMSVQNTLAYLKKVMGTESHEDWRNHIINTNEYFVLKDIPVNSLRSDLSGLDKANVEKYKQMDFSKAPPIVIGSDGNILDGYHRVNVAKALKVPTLKAWVGVKKQGVAEDTIDENLRQWFKEKWVRFGPDGKIRGACARGDDSEGKPKCLPQSKAHSLGKKGRASAAARKRREDPNPERSGAAINVATKKKTDEEQLDELKCWPGYTRVKGVPAGAPGSCKKKTSEDQAPMFTPESKCPHCGGPMFEAMLMNEKKDACYYKVKSRYKVWPSAYASGALVKCRKKGAKNWGNKSESVELNELSTEKLAQYKKAAGEDARKADKEGDFERGNKRFSGIVKATKKQFDNETKPKKESAIMKGLVDENLGTPYPGTYEQEFGPFKRKGSERVIKMTTEGKKNVSRRA